MYWAESWVNVYTLNDVWLKPDLNITVWIMSGAKTRVNVILWVISGLNKN